MPWGGTWTADGNIVYVPNFPAGLWRVAGQGGVPEQLTKPDGAGAGYAHVFPQSVAGTDDVLFGFWGKTFYNALLSLQLEGVAAHHAADAHARAVRRACTQPAATSSPAT